MGYVPGEKQLDICTVGLCYKFATSSEDTDKASVIKYNSDGTLPVDVLRTGVWSHLWYGTIKFTESDLQTIIDNFNKGVTGYVITFNYYHDRNKNFGKPVRLRLEKRMAKFSGKEQTYLVADVQLTEQGKADVESGEVLNFSAEVNSNYRHRELLEVPLYNEDGEPVVDEDGNHKVEYQSVEFGPTLLGGAVTNYPFITDMNPEGLGGNRQVLGDDEQDYSLVVFDSSDQGDKNIMLFDALIDGRQGMGAEDDAIKGSSAEDKIFNDSEKDVDVVILADEEYRAGDAALPDAAYAIVYTTKGKSGKTIKIRKLPHHTKEVTDPNDNSSLDIPRLKNALARINQVKDVPQNLIDKARAHLERHADATYRKKSKASNNSEEASMSEQHKPVTEQVTKSIGDDIKFDDDAMKQYFDDKVSEIRQMFDAKLAEREAEFKARLEQFEEREKELEAQKKQVEELLAEQQRKAWHLFVDNFVNDLDGVPAFADVARRVLMANMNVELNYVDEDETKAMPLHEIVAKFAAVMPKVEDNSSADDDNEFEAPNDGASDNGVMLKFEGADGNEIIASYEDVVNDPKLWQSYMRSIAVDASGRQIFTVKEADNG